MISAETTKTPIYLYLLLFSSISIITGVVWDISWHMSIGRDTLFSPPHLAIYTGGILAGIISGIQIISITFFGSRQDKESSINFLGICAPLGALFCIWGGLTMVISAPFDDWWHNAYGLDVKILSPPHVVLAMGIASIEIGTLISILAIQNRTEHAQGHYNMGEVSIMFAISASILIMVLSVFVIENMRRGNMHQPIYYQIGCGVFPLLIIACAIASPLRWPATTFTSIYFLFFALQLLIFPLFPAVPKLAPIRNPVTYMVPLPFPILLFIPGFVLDLVLKTTKEFSGLTRSIIVGTTFFIILFMVQWFFGYYLISPYAQNRFFGTHYFPFYVDTNFPSRFSFRPYPGSGFSYILGFGLALMMSILSTRVGLLWGQWMKKVRR